MIRRRRCRDRGSVMMLFPAAVVIILLLGALVVDSAIVFLAQRHAHGIALDAANDAAGAGLDSSAYRSGELVVDPDRARSIASRSLRSAATDGVELVAVSVSEDGAVTVTVAYEVERLFGEAFGLGDTTDTISVTADGRTGDD